MNRLDTGLVRLSIPAGWRELPAPEPGAARLAGPRGQIVQLLGYELSVSGEPLATAKERLADVLEDSMLQACEGLGLEPYTPLLAGRTAGGDPVVELHSRSEDHRRSLSQWYCVGPRGGFLLTCEWAGDLGPEVAMSTLDAVRGALHELEWVGQ